MHSRNTGLLGRLWLSESLRAKLRRIELTRAYRNLMVVLRTVGNQKLYARISGLQCCTGVARGSWRPMSHRVNQVIPGNATSGANAHSASERVEMQASPCNAEGLVSRTSRSYRASPCSTRRNIPPFATQKISLQPTCEPIGPSHRPLVTARPVPKPISRRPTTSPSWSLASQGAPLVILRNASDSIP